MLGSSDDSFHLMCSGGNVHAHSNDGENSHDVSVEDSVGEPVTVLLGSSKGMLSSLGKNHSLDESNEANDTEDIVNAKLSLGHKSMVVWVVRVVLFNLLFSLPVVGVWWVWMSLVEQLFGNVSCVKGTMSHSKGGDSTDTDVNDGGDSESV